MTADILPFVPSPATDLPTDTAEPLTVDGKGLAKLLGLGLRTIRTHDAAGKLPTPIRIGGRVLWAVDEIRAWLAAGAPDRAAWAAIRRTTAK